MLLCEASPLRRQANEHVFAFDPFLRTSANQAPCTSYHPEVVLRRSSFVSLRTNARRILWLLGPHVKLSTRHLDGGAFDARSWMLIAEIHHNRFRTTAVSGTPRCQTSQSSCLLMVCNDATLMHADCVSGDNMPGCLAFRPPMETFGSVTRHPSIFKWPNSPAGVTEPSSDTAG